MMSREDITAKLKEDSSWEPSEDATDEEWDLYYEVRSELGLDDDQEEKDEEDWSEEDDSSGWDDDDEDW